MDVPIASTETERIVVVTWPRFTVCVIAVFVVQAIVAGGLHACLEHRLHAAPGFFRPEENEKLGIYLVSRVVFVALFVWLFFRTNREHRPHGGVRFGLLIWCFYTIPMTAGLWCFIQMPVSLATAWIVIGLAELTAGGAVLGLLQGPRPQP
jgi:hypothetical protein